MLRSYHARRHGTFRIDVDIEIGNSRQPEKKRALRSVLVDTGAGLSWMPADVLESLGIERRSRWRFRQADGMILERWTGPPFVYAEGKTATDDVVFGDPATRCCWALAGRAQSAN
jgi:hypothetical protein